MPRAFLLADSSTYDTRKAEKHGDRVFLFDHEPHPLQVGQLAHSVRARLEELAFDPLNDYIVLTGNNVSVAILCAVVAAHYGAFNLLAYDAKSGYYVTRAFAPAA